MAPSAKHPRTLAMLLWLCAQPALAGAQEPRDATAPDSGPSTDTPARSSSPEPERESTVLFLLPSNLEGGQGQLRDALLAQFALIDATLVFEPQAASDGSLSARLAEAQDLGASHHAIAVFWLDAQPDGHWFLHMMDAQDERVIVRRVDATGERRAAAIEAVAVMTRSSARALIEDVVEPATPATPPPPAEAQPAAASSARDGIRLSLGYIGNDFAREVDWQHGVEIGIAWLGFAPFYGRLAFLWLPPAKVDDARVSFSIERTPFAAQLGYRLVSEPLALDAEVGLMLDWVHRPASMPGTVMGQDLEAHSGSTGVMAALSPRLRAELRILPVLGLYAGGGLDILLNNFPYMTKGYLKETLLTPNGVRPVALLGVSFYP